jgi:hypothetical protein
LTSAHPPVTASVTLQGPGASALAIDGVGAYLLFVLNDAGGSVTMSGITIQHGSGGAIMVDNGTLSLNNYAITTNCTLSGNNGNTAYGGGGFNKLVPVNG